MSIIACYFLDDSDLLFGCKDSENNLFHKENSAFFVVQPARMLDSSTSFALLTIGNIRQGPFTLSMIF